MDLYFKNVYISYFVKKQSTTSYLIKQSYIRVQNIPRCVFSMMVDVCCVHEYFRRLGSLQYGGRYTEESGTVPKWVPSGLSLTVRMTPDHVHVQLRMIA